jgi:Icc-related predicted phosphoesterase
MTRLVHLTDLHFGLHRQDLVRPLADSILSTDCDVVVVSGDLTQRARVGQFRASLAFLDGLALPYLAVPGNHDIPLFNPFLRLFDPFGRYRRHVAQNMAPIVEIGRLRLCAINTGNPFRWRGGIARREEIARICESLRARADDMTNILISHHPLEEPPGFIRGETRGARDALANLAKAGVHIILSGHLHYWSTGLGIIGHKGRRVFQMQTGTALCNRQKDRDHGFAVLDIGRDSLSVTPWIVNEATARFEPRAKARFAVRGGCWLPENTTRPPA